MNTRQCHFFHSKSTFDRNLWWFMCFYKVRTYNSSAMSEINGKTISCSWNRKHVIQQKIWLQFKRECKCLIFIKLYFIIFLWILYVNKNHKSPSERNLTHCAWQHYHYHNLYHLLLVQIVTNLLHDAILCIRRKNQFISCPMLY